ncbi:hypothetical protein PpBr36_07888 [Pyricularia pennisetigena]|uniref:hypothetical protein n=1 Tax=Pyricularia pennisetigena TaxID=1578925 RepID=UPI0011544BD9|nr:hypothetical protein PpBr36_07888 [Pyricularia pennisetigena]TLS25881.1 hypothetical protein PpBr36_07888 [Pyricularia pennisetigena]
MDSSDEDDFRPRNIAELNRMGWARVTFIDTDSRVVRQMLKLLFNDFYIKRISIAHPPADNIYTPLPMTPEQLEWLENWKAWEISPSEPPPWPETKLEEFSDYGGRRQASHCGKRSIFGSLFDFVTNRKSASAK